MPCVFEFFVLFVDAGVLPWSNWAARRYLLVRSTFLGSQACVSEASSDGQSILGSARGYRCRYPVAAGAAGAGASEDCGFEVGLETLPACATVESVPVIIFNSIACFYDRMISAEDGFSEHSQTLGDLESRAFKLFRDVDAYCMTRGLEMEDYFPSVVHDEHTHTHARARFSTKSVSVGVSNHSPSPYFRLIWESY